nr:hypothetical protein BHI3_12100 [Bacteriovorax sp. HI3]
MKISLLVVLAAFVATGNTNETTYSYMDSAAPHDNHSAAYPDHAKVRTTTMREKDEISDTANVNQAATRRDYSRENDPMRRGSSPGCKNHNGQWLRPQDEGYRNCMNMPDTEKK